MPHLGAVEAGNLADSSKKLPLSAGPIELRFKNRVGFAGALVMGKSGPAGCHTDGGYGPHHRTEDARPGRESRQPECGLFQRQVNARTVLINSIKFKCLRRRATVGVLINSKGSLTRDLNRALSQGK